MYIDCHSRSRPSMEAESCAVCNIPTEAGLRAAKFFFCTLLEEIVQFPGGAWFSLPLQAVWEVLGRTNVADTLLTHFFTFFYKTV